MVLGKIMSAATASFNNVKTVRDLSERSEEEKRVWEEAHANEEVQRKILDETKMKLDHIKFETVEDDVLLQCLRIRRFNQDEAVELIHEYVEFREKNNWPTRMTTKDHAPGIFETKVHEILPVTDLEGRKIITMVVKHLDLNLFSAEAYQKLAAYLLEQVTLGNIHAQDNGIALLLDLADVSFSTLTKMTNDDIARGIEIFSKGAIKIKKVYVVNTNMTYRFCIKTALSFLSSSKRKMIKVMSKSNYDQLHEDVSCVEKLPPQYQ